jgi:hypothetical protein
LARQAKKYITEFITETGVQPHFWPGEYLLDMFDSFVTEDDKDEGLETPVPY